MGKSEYIEGQLAGKGGSLKSCKLFWSRLLPSAFCPQLPPLLAPARHALGYIACAAGLKPCFDFPWQANRRPLTKPSCKPSPATAQAQWRRAGSNRQPPACKAGALPIELRPRPKSSNRVGAPRFELGTSALSGLRSNQLSYAPACTPNGLSRLSPAFHLRPSPRRKFAKTRTGNASLAPGGFPPPKRA